MSGYFAVARLDAKPVEEGIHAGRQPFFPEPQFASLAAKHLGIREAILTVWNRFLSRERTLRTGAFPSPIKTISLCAKKAVCTHCVLGGGDGDDVLMRQAGRLARSFGGNASGSGWRRILTVTRRRCALCRFFRPQNEFAAAKHLATT